MKLVMLVAYVLTGIPFKFVSIKEEKEKDEFGYRSFGQVANENQMTPEEWEKHSITDPVEFNTFFKDDFTKLTGLVAERIYRGRFNYKAAKGDFRQWVGTSLNRLPELMNAKKSFGKKLHSEPIIADANCTKICVYMSLVLLVSSLFYELTGFAYADAIGATGLTYFSISEGKEAFEKAKGKECEC